MSRTHCVHLLGSIKCRESLCSFPSVSLFISFSCIETGIPARFCCLFVSLPGQTAPFMFSTFQQALSSALCLGGKGAVRGGQMLIPGGDPWGPFSNLLLVLQISFFHGTLGEIVSYPYVGGEC